MVIEMSNSRLAVSYEGKHIYDIVFKNDFNGLKEELFGLNCLKRKICIVTDSNVNKLYADDLTAVLKQCVRHVIVFSFPAGEANKNLTTVQTLYAFLIENHFDRGDILAALGGGVVGDLTGFVAATYLRGIRFIQIPTTLLAMADSSVGGKTGVDFDSYKNMVGAFHMPKLVYMNISTLHSLDERQYHAGFGEVIKHGLIKDLSYFTWLKEHYAKLEARDGEILKVMVIRNCEIKRDVVEKDPKEQGERALLNFGHTLGHAIEKLKNFIIMHGECIALGMVAASYISYQRGNITKLDFENIIAMFKTYSLPVSLTDLTKSEVLDAASHDKKNDAGTLKFILLSSLGHAVIDTTVTRDEMETAIEYLLC